MSDWLTGASASSIEAPISRFILFLSLKRADLRRVESAVIVGSALLKGLATGTSSARITRDLEWSAQDQDPTSVRADIEVVQG